MKKQTYLIVIIICIIFCFCPSCSINSTQHSLSPLKFEPSWMLRSEFDDGYRDILWISIWNTGKDWYMLEIPDITQLITITYSDGTKQNVYESDGYQEMEFSGSLETITPPFSIPPGFGISGISNSRTNEEFSLFVDYASFTKSDITSIIIDGYEYSVKEKKEYEDIDTTTLSFGEIIYPYGNIQPKLDNLNQSATIPDIGKVKFLMGEREVNYSISVDAKFTNDNLHESVDIISACYLIDSGGGVIVPKIHLEDGSEVHSDKVSLSPGEIATVYYDFELYGGAVEEGLYDFDKFFMFCEGDFNTIIKLDVTNIPIILNNIIW